MPGYVFRDAAFLGNDLDSVPAMIIAGNGQKPAVLCHAAILLDDMPGHFQQTDVGFHACLLTVGLYPKMSVEGVLQVIFREIIHISPTQPREGAEDEEIPDEFKTFLFERPVDE